MLKPAISYNEQILTLKNKHNLIVDDNEEAISILKKVNYYRLSGYGIGLKKKDIPEEYKDGITINHLFDLYCFDSQLRHNIFKSIEQLEVQLRTQIAYLHGNKYGPEGYRDPLNFKDYSSKSYTSVYQKTIDDIDHMIKKQKHLPYIKHHFQTYKGHFPIWVAIESCTFGSLSYLFTLLHSADQKEIAHLYNTTPKYLRSWIVSLVEIRNMCAHYNRLYNSPLQNTPLLYSEYKHFNASVQRLFPILLIIKRMLKNNEQWESLYRDLCTTFKKYEGIPNLSFIGFPNNWQEILSEKQF